MFNTTDNVCTFLPQLSRGETKILHVVYETKRQSKERTITLSFYRIHYVFSGEATLHAGGSVQGVRGGDVFICPPSHPYSIEGDENFKFGYISLTGAKITEICKRLDVLVPKVFPHHEEVGCLFEKCINSSGEWAAILADGCATYTLGIIYEGKSTENKEKTSDTPALVQHYVDDHFSDPSLSLESLCRDLAYNPKYISTLFVRKFGTTFSKYLNTVRINNAAALIGCGFTSVKEIATLCGFSDALYFSRVFKSSQGVSPKEFINNAHNIKQKDIS